MGSHYSSCCRRSRLSCGSNSQVTTRDTQLEKQRIAKNQISLTNFGNTSEPAIAAGSVVEIGGALFVFSSDEAITGWGGVSNDTDAYIKLVPGVGLVTAEFVEAAPTWSDSKQGWYNGIDRYVAGLHRGAGAGDYEDKWVYQKSQDKTDDHRFFGTGVVEFDSGIVGDLTGDVTGDVDGAIIEQKSSNRLLVAVFAIGDWDMDGSPNKTVTHGMGAVWFKSVRMIGCIIRDDADAIYLPGWIWGGTAVPGLSILKPDVTTINLTRKTAGTFDNTNYNETPFNRGWITAWYEG